MTGTERALSRHWRGLAVLCALVALAGVAVILWHRMDAQGHAYDELSAEADLRGTAVSTLAGDVRQLRSQLQAEGKTPAAPDPEQAVKDLPQRAEVPVPIPGPRGLPGQDGKPGSPGTNGSDGPTGAPGTAGRDGAQGEQGATGPQGPAGPTGPAGPQGPPGVDGKDGQDGADGQPCPEGYSWQTPDYDPDARVCRKDGAPNPEPSPSEKPGLLSMGLDPQRRQYP